MFFLTYSISSFCTAFLDHYTPLVYDEGFSLNKQFNNDTKQRHLCIDIQAGYIEGLPTINDYFFTLSPQYGVFSFLSILERVSNKMDYILDLILIFQSFKVLKDTGTKKNKFKLKIVGRVIASMKKNITDPKMSGEYKIELSKSDAEILELDEIELLFGRINKVTKKIKFSISFEAIEVLTGKGIISFPLIETAIRQRVLSVMKKTK